jgi:3-deoxy-7-phosphoheptulonate synthase
VVVIIEPKATEEQIQNVIKHLEDYGFQIHKSVGIQNTIIGAIGVKPDFDTRKIKILDGVADVYRVTVPFKLASRNFHELDTVIDIKGVKIGGNELAIMAGPCSIESEEQIFKLAEIVAKSGAKILRGGAFKPRSSPYSFQGMGEED